MNGFTRQRARSGRPAWRLAMLFACAAVVLRVGTASAVQSVASPPAKELFQQGRHQEDAVGNLEAAIQVYRRVLAASPDRALAANAQLRIGLCLEKLGRAAEARQAFEIVVRDYSDQASTVAEARSRLARQAPAMGSTPSGTGVHAEQLWSGNDIEGDASLSPDGRYLVYSSWSENGNLLLKDLTTGVVRPITRDSALRTNGTPQPWSPSFSPDGNRIAFPWYEGRGADSRTSLRVIDRDGSNSRLLATGAGVDLVYDWSPDGRAVAVNLYATGQSRLAVVSVADGSVAPLRSTGWRKATGVRFSPDGKLLTYSVQAVQGQAQADVFLLAVDGRSEEVRLTEGASPAWTPDGRAVVFFSDRSGTSDLWTMPVTNGKPGGEPTILRRNAGGTNHGFTRDGSLFYETRSLGRDLLVAKIELAGGRATDPINLSNSFVGSNGGGSWSPDGRHVAFVRGSDRLATRIVIRSVATGEERTLPGTLDDGLMGHNQGIRWLSGRALLVRGGGNGRIAFKRTDVETGSQHVLFDAPMTAWARGFDVSSDGRFLYYISRNDTAAGGVMFRVIRRDVTTGAESDVYRPAVAGGLDLALSPDGTQLAIRQSGRLVVQPVAGGVPTEVQRGPDSLKPLAWTRDGRYVVGVLTRNDLDHLYAVPSSGGTVVDLGISASNILHASVSPTDGRVVVSVARPSHELWLVRNLLKSPAAR